MAKRLFTMSKRAEKILSHFREKNTNLSEYISKSVIDETLPVYSKLRIEALYLLDYVTDHAADWTGEKLKFATGIDETQYYTIQTLERGASWLKKHHIQNPTILKEMTALFEADTSNTMQHNSYTADHIQQAHKKIASTIQNVSDLPDNFCDLTNIILNNWEFFWDWDISYELIIDVILCEKPISNIDPFFAINVLQRIETQFILESIGEIK